MLVGKESPDRNTCKAYAFSPGAIDFENRLQPNVDEGVDYEGDPADQDKSQNF